MDTWEVAKERNVKVKNIAFHIKYESFLVRIGLKLLVESHRP